MRRRTVGAELGRWVRRKTLNKSTRPNVTVMLLMMFGADRGKADEAPRLGSDAGRA